MSPGEGPQIFEQLRAANPAPRSELLYDSPFELLIAVILSAQATDKGVNLATRALFRDAPHAAGDASNSGWPASSATSAPSACTTPRRATSWPPAGCWWSATAARCRASARPSKPCRAWGARPRTWCSTWLSANPRMAVDTHVFRVANRTGLARGDNPRAVEDELLRVIPRGVHAARASLADPARPLHLQGARARLSALPDRALVRIPA